MARQRNSVVLLVATALVLLLLLPAGPSRPASVHAADCSQGNTGTLVVRIVDTYTNNPVEVEGSVVLVQPNPWTFQLDHLVTDLSVTGDAHAGADRDPLPGVIRIEDACSTQSGEIYQVALWDLPDALDDCIKTSTLDSTTLAAGETAVVHLRVDCTGVFSPTATPTSTPGTAATVVTSVSPLAVGCNGTSIVTVNVRDAAGQAVPAGTPVTIATNLGAVSPSSGHVTGANGGVTAFFTAPADTGGIATVTATAGSGAGAASVTVTCGPTPVPGVAATATVAPPPATGGGTGFIQPPATGSAGLTGGQRGAAPAVFAVVALMFVAATLAARAISRRAVRQNRR